MGFFPTLIIRQGVGEAQSFCDLSRCPILQIVNSKVLFCCSVIKSYPTLWPVDCSLPGSSVHGISQARIMEWVGISFSRGSSRPKDRTHISYIGRQIFFFNRWAIREAPEVLWTPSVKVFMEASLHRCDWLDRWPLVINSDSSSFHPPPPTLSGDGVRRGGACWKFQPSKETSLLPTSPILRGCPKVRSFT